MVIVFGFVDGGGTVKEEDSWCQIGWVYNNQFFFFNSSCDPQRYFKWDRILLWYQIVTQDNQNLMLHKNWKHKKLNKKKKILGVGT